MIYILERPGWNYDEVVSCVVVASSETEARQTAHDWEMSTQERDEFSRADVNVAMDWLDEEKSTATHVPVSMSLSRVIHEHIHHG